ncbi:TonB-dependent receptor family protein [Rubricoccus marinus]|uniref:TonB-dependent receptor n=1 Tax=Rubricoccus marinus TaxID=716817 RepID=A0A259U2Z2_9BACT|nr:TonB-dependent receptor [Rubricoccus marinus]OZC04332.1 hypothetical protein BSZ36_15920 [Rubricoccus marinus]
MRRLLTLTLLLAASGARGQAPAPDTLALPSVRVEATRSEGGIARAPFSVAVIERGITERSANAGAGLETALRSLPGLFVADRENAALGERLIVRGQGYRSAFGVRGVQVVLDGIPLTLADGQAVLGVVDPETVRRAEIVRGPASALWGNGSGGVLFLDTVPPEDTATAQLTGGAYGLIRASGEGATRLGAGRVGLAVSRTERTGYRDYSAQEVYRARGFADLPLSLRADLRILAALEESPLLQHPGALTLEDLETDRRQAETRYVDSNSGKRSTQGQLSARLRAVTPEATYSATAYGIARDLRNPLPFAYIGVDRLAGGLRLSAERDLGPLAVALGADGAVQRDSRFNAPNENGEPGAVRDLDQLETVASGGLFARAGLPLAGPLRAEAALRADRVRFSADDRLLSDGDQSGSRTLGAFSPQVGLSYRSRGVLAFASFATGFQTPTTTELVNRPEGGGGFNAEVGPQRSSGVELGARGVILGRALVDVAVYSLVVRDGLAPFEGEDGRTFYANRERTTHRGLEAFAEWSPLADVRATATYAYSRLRFASAHGTDELDGNTLPGVPEHRLSARIRFSRGGFFLAPEASVRSRLWADDANTADASGAVVLDLALGHEGLRAGGATLLPFVRIQNVLDAQTVGSVAINARGGRYYEPAPGRGVSAGLSVRL